MNTGSYGIDYWHWRISHISAAPIVCCIRRCSFRILGWARFSDGWSLGGERATVCTMIIISSMALLVSPMQMDNLAQPVQTGMAHAILFAGIVFLSVGLLAESTTRRQKLAYTAISAGAIILAAFSMLQGLVGASLVVVLAFLLRVPTLSRAVLAAVLGACIVVDFFWPCGYRWPIHHQPFFRDLLLGRRNRGICRAYRDTFGDIRRVPRPETGHHYRFSRNSALVARAGDHRATVAAGAPN